MNEKQRLCTFKKKTLYVAQITSERDNLSNSLQPISSVALIQSENPSHRQLDGMHNPFEH